MFIDIKLIKIHSEEELNMRLRKVQYFLNIFYDKVEEEKKQERDLMIANESDPLLK